MRNFDFGILGFINILTPLVLKNKTKDFGLRIIKMADSLPNTRSANVIANQILRSATSVGANYRSACRASSKADFISKITVVEEEADETLFWLEIIHEAGLMKFNRLESLLKEADELVAIFYEQRQNSKIK